MVENSADRDLLTYFYDPGTTSAYCMEIPVWERIFYSNPGKLLEWILQLYPLDFLD